MKNKLYELCTFLFIPIGIIYEKIYVIRRYLYQQGFISSYKLSVPTISVGNIALGGTGKTPFVLWLGQKFTDLNKKSMVLMRGYKGGFEHSDALLKSKKIIGQNAATYGDEAVLIANRSLMLDVVVGKKRHENYLKHYKNVSPDVVILDDGFQHLNLKRDLDLVLFDAQLPVSKYKCPPLGYLREGVKSLKYADAIIINKAEKIDASELQRIKSFLKGHAKKTPIIVTKSKVASICYSDGSVAFDLENLKNKKLTGLVGIASPESFFDSIEQLGGVVTSRKVFPDHHNYNVEEITRVVNSLSTDDWVITTEKDIIKVRQVTDYERLVYLKIDLVITEGELILEQLLSNIINHNGL